MSLDPPIDPPTGPPPTIEEADGPEPVAPEPLTDDEVADEADEPRAWVPPRERLTRLVDRAAGMRVEGWISLAVVAACVGVVFWAVHPEWVFRNTTTTGGDMGSHVYGPKYLMDHLLPAGRLNGWTPAWFDGFPLYQFYMVLPALGVVLLAVGIHNVFLCALVVLLGLAVASLGWVREGLARFRWPLTVLGIAMVVLAVPVPYNIAFKMVVVSGLLTLPIAAWLCGKLSGLPFPTPPLLAVAALLYLFNKEPVYNGTGNIVGGNFASTMAGEYSFSIALSLGVAYLGVLMYGMRTGKHRVLAAVLLALTGLAHLLPAFFFLLVTVLVFLVQPAKARARWFAWMLPLAGLLSAFWVLPFVSKRAFTNDMGWEKLPILPPDVRAKWGTWFTEQLSNGATYRGIWYYLAPPHMRWIVVLALAGAVISAVQLRRLGWVLTIAAGILGVLFVNLPNLQLWNARLLPFLYLCVYFLAAIAVGEVVYCLAVVIADLVQRRAEPNRVVGWVAAPALAVAGIIAVLVPLGMMPGSTHRTVNYVSGWAKGNFSGLEHKDENPTLQSTDANCQATPKPHCAGGSLEYFALVDTMQKLGADEQYGCGRAMWEYEGDREGSYGTPMALMMLPYFTDDCIGSMEGLYFESSGTTPFHFMNQTEMSTKPSSTQRDLPYSGMNMPLGVRHLQMLGVKYFMAVSPNAVAQANLQKDLTPIANSGPWHIYEVANSELVTPLSNLPAVMTNVEDPQHSWLPAAMSWYLDPTWWKVPLAIDGPANWPRVSVTKLSPPKSEPGTPDPKVTDYVTLPKPPTKPVTPAKVTNIVERRDGISFDVDRVGSPVLVKISDFPNWEATGATGPYRVTPNLMVVVPTAKHVSLHYGRTTGDLFALLLTLIGIGVAVWLSGKPAIEMPPSRWSSAMGGPDPATDDDPGEGTDPLPGFPAGPDDPAAGYESWAPPPEAAAEPDAEVLGPEPPATPPVEEPTDRAAEGPPAAPATVVREADDVDPDPTSPPTA